MNRQLRGFRNVVSLCFLCSLCGVGPSCERSLALWRYPAPVLLPESLRIQPPEGLVWVARYEQWPDLDPARFEDPCLGNHNIVVSSTFICDPRTELCRRAEPASHADALAILAVAMLDGKRIEPSSLEGAGNIIRGGRLWGTELRDVSPLPGGRSTTLGPVSCRFAVFVCDSAVSAYPTACFWQYFGAGAEESTR